MKAAWQLSNWDMRFYWTIFLFQYILQEFLLYYIIFSRFWYQPENPCNDEWSEALKNAFIGKDLSDYLIFNRIRDSSHKKVSVPTHNFSACTRL